uniref:Uncharacterized protein n=1 Tax=Timema tahoe TaxID=61484 RepID=A0A7R9NYK1_9NEOP|nr:unnamed protein product [Timema tahoe]
MTSRFGRLYVVYSPFWWHGVLLPGRLVIGSLVYCESSALDHVAPEVGPELSQNTRRTIYSWKPSQCQELCKTSITIITQRLPVRRTIARFETDFQSATNKFLDKF